MTRPQSLIWKVVHCKDGVETVYLVSAVSRREAEGAVLDSLYERHYAVEPTYTTEELANDTFGLKAHAARYGNERSNYGLCKMHGCSISAAVWSADVPYKLYALNTRTGEMA